ncbi:glycosyltransferase [Pseudomonas alcaligenes]|uniref:glycosyltransferase n=1 Tax=Pseudomonas sp. RIT-PI-AD TaxID=3035294 RepID=UPI0021DA37F4
MEEPSGAPRARRDGPRVLQFCHGYDGPFLDCARQYASLFAGTPYAVTTVYLTGAPSAAVERGSASDEVIFLDYSSRDVRGLKLKAIADLRRLLRGRDFRFCIAHRFKPVYVALLASTLPVIGVHHAFGDYRRLSRRLFARLFRARLSLLGVSNAVRDDMRACLPDWPAERIETLYNRLDRHAVQGALLEPGEARRALGLPETAWILGNVGRLHPDKDQATLIRAFAQALPGLPAGSLLAIMGSGRLESELNALADRLGVAGQVRFLGQVADARHYFRAFDLFVLSSDHEPFGMVLLEAMAAGVPVVGSDCGGAPEVLEGAGTCFPLGDVVALAAALTQASRREAAQVEDERRRQLQRLDALFSDAAARQRFWTLPMTAGYR